jgi:hypothetical protein
MATPTILRDSRLPDNLKGLAAISLACQIDAQGISGMSEARLAAAARQLIEQRGLALSSSNAPVLTVGISTELRSAPLSLVYGVEVVLREQAGVSRASGVLSQHIVETWRHQTMSGVLFAPVVEDNAREMLGQEALRQVTVFLDDWATINTLPQDDTVPVSSTRVTTAKQLLAAGATYPQGCSEFVCKVLGIPWEDANSLMGGSPTLVGDNNTYPGLVLGDVVGWKVGGGSGHVAIYIGEAGTKFIDVRQPGATPRSVANGYGNGRPLFKSAKY